MIFKILKCILYSIIGLIAILIATLYITDNDYILKGICITYFNGHKTAFLDDYKYFENRQIDIGTPQPWPISKDYNKASSTGTLDSIHKNLKSIAYIIIKNDSILYEKYYNATDSTLSNSFSMAKSIVSASLGKAIELGYIKSIDDKVIDYLPELSGKYSSLLTIKDLVSMRSGLKWDESYYSPFSITTKAYFYNNLSKAILELPIEDLPGKKFKYQSGDTQLLAMVLSKALPISLSDFVSKYFWQPMGAEHTALWQFNKKDGIEKAYCCIASNAKDFARFGKLYLHQGNWNGQSILNAEYIKHSIEPAAENSQQYGYGWWLSKYKNKNVYAMNGHLGQYVIVIPEDKLIVVRLGHQHDGKNSNDPNSAFYQYIDQAYEMMEL